MDQETKNEIKVKFKEFAPPIICLDPKLAIAAVITNKKHRNTMLEAYYTGMEKQYERYMEQVQEWEKTKKKLEKHKTRNVKIEKMFNKQF